MSFQTNDQDQHLEQATTALAHDGKSMFQYTTTTTDHGSPLMEHVQHQPFENGLDEFPNHSSNSESLRRIRDLDVDPPFPCVEQILVVGHSNLLSEN